VRPSVEENALRVRLVTEADAEELLSIYAPYVTDTAVSFEYEVPSLEEFRDRIRQTLERFPYLAAEDGGVILGYVYVSSFKEREAYSWSVETSIYVRRDSRRRGVGRRLYEALEAALAAQGVRNLNACIACPPTEDDPYLTRDSVAFHQRMGYQLAGHFHQCASKFGRWYDMVWMEKSIGDHPPDQAPVRPFPEVCPGLSAR